MGKSLKPALPYLLIIVLVGIAFGAGFKTARLDQIQAPEELTVVSEAWDVIHRDYVGKSQLDSQKLAGGAAKGLLEALNDPYSAYIDAAHYKTVQTHFTGQDTFGGIGALINSREGQLTVISVIPQTPAEKAGIKPGDIILAVNGESTKGMTAEEGVVRVRGEIGTQVTLQVLHRGEEAPRDIVITREQIKRPSVATRMVSEDVGLIYIYYFTERTESEFVPALADLHAQGATRLVLDLRDNPGGPVDAAVGVVSQFVDQGMVAYGIDGNGNKQTWDAEEGGTALDTPLVVLVNGDSASASELVAGALQDYGRAKLIGVKTFGKGSFNQFDVLSDGSAVYLTVGRWYTPNGRLIEGQGLTPDIGVERTQQDIDSGADPQLDKALEHLQSVQ